MSSTATLPSPLRDRLGSLAGRARRVRAVRGVSAVVLFLAVVAGLAMAADYFLDLPALVRQATFVVWAGLGVVLFGERFCLPVLRRPDDASLAAAVEEAYPDLDERLSSTVALAGRDDVRHGAPAFVALLARETDEQAGPLNFMAALPWRTVSGVATLAACALTLLLSPALVWPAEYGDLAHRFLLPWSELPPYLFTVLPGDVVAARGSSVTVEATVRPRSARIPAPAYANLVLVDADGNETVQRMRVDRSDAFSLPLTLAADGTYRIEAHASAVDHGAASARYHVTAVPPVELMPDSPTITVTPPTYARGTHDEETVSGLVDLVALQGSLVRFELHFTRPAVAARLEVSGEGARTTEHQLVLTDGGRAAEVSVLALATGSYRLDLEAEHGVHNQLDGGTLTVKPDQPPTVMKFTGRDELKAITPYDKLALECGLVDDVGVARADIEYRVNQGPPVRVPFPLTGAGRLEAAGQILFSFDGKVRNGDQVSYRLRVEDNLPAALKGPHVVYAPADHWLSLKVVRQPGPVREQEIAASRDAIDRRIEAIKQALLQEMRGLYKLKLESRLDASLSPEQRDGLSALERQNQSTEKALRDMVREADGTPPLQPLADAARDIADRNMQKSEAALWSAGTARMPAQDRDGKLKEADEHLSDALQKLDDLKKQNEQIAKDRADQLRFEALADKQRKLADKAADLAKQDADKDPAVKEQTEQLRRDQADTADELQRLAEQSPLLRKSLEEARAEQAKQAADRAGELADAQRALNKAKTDGDAEQNTNRFADLAERQRQLADKAARFAEETKQPARTAGVQPFRPDEARRAADALKDGDAREALKRQDKLASDLDRLADGMDRALDLARDPREAAKQLARLQDDLRQRVQDEMYRKDAARPLAERLAGLVREEQAIRKAIDKLPLGPEEAEAKRDRKTAAEKAARAADMLRNGEGRPALGPIGETQRALEQLAERLPTKEERERKALREVTRLRKDQEEIGRSVEQAARDARQKDDPGTAESARRNLAEAAKQQAELASDLSKLNVPSQEGRRNRAAAAVEQARNDLEKALPEDAEASQQQARRELRRLEQALAGIKSADEVARDLAKRQQDLADAARSDKATPRQREDIQVKQQQLARVASSLPPSDAPQRQAEAGEAARQAAQAADKDPTSPEAQQAMEKAARKFDDLARQLSGQESDAARADRLARRQAQVADEADKQLQKDPNKAPPPESQRSQDEIAREASQLRAGPDNQAAKRDASRALDEAQSSANPQEQARAQKKAAEALRDLADKLAKNPDSARPADTKPSDANDRPAQRQSADDAAAPRGLPSKAASEQARQLAREERDLREAVRKADSEERAPNNQRQRPDPLGELSKQQADVARQSAELSRDVTQGQGEQSEVSRQGESASKQTREAADRLQNGELPAARAAGKQAAERLRQLAEDLAKTPRSDAEKPDKDLLRQARDLAEKQEAINRNVAEQSADSASRRGRQQARQQELRQQAGELEKDLERLAKEMNDPQQGGQAARQAAAAAREAQRRMEQAQSGDPTQSRQGQDQAAQALDRAAQQANRASSQQQAGNNKGQGKDSPGSSEAGQSVRQAQNQMDQAQGQLGKGKASSARQSMENAAKALQQAAGQLSQNARSNTSGNPNQSNSPGQTGPTASGRPDPSMLGPGLSKYAGKTWGELPGELRTKIVQDMKANYGEDYARMIKLYFEQLADTKREGK